jgi:hypothetical protein
MSKEPGQLAFEASGGSDWDFEGTASKARWAAVEAAVRADATRELVEALEPFAAYRTAYIDGPGTPDHGLPANTPHRVGDYRRARAALEKAKTPPAV